MSGGGCGGVLSDGEKPLESWADGAKRIPRRRKKGARVSGGQDEKRACRVDSMRRLLALAMAIFVIGLVACGGADKTPLMPDSVEPTPSLEGPDAAAPAPSSGPSRPAN
jgi:hypothetical protein